MEGLLANVTNTVFSTSLETIVIIVAFVLVVLYAARVRRGKMSATLIAALLTGPFYQFVSTVQGFEVLARETADTLLVRIAVFAVFFVLLTILFRKLVHGEYASVRIRKITQVGLLSVGLVGVISVSFYQILHGTALYPSPLFGDVLFGSDISLALWWTIALITLFESTRK